MSYYITSPIYRTHSFSIFSLPGTLVLAMVRTATRTTTAVILLRQQYIQFL